MRPSKWSYLDWVALVFDITFDELAMFAGMDNDQIYTVQNGGELSKVCNDKLAKALSIQPIDLRYLYRVFHERRLGKDMVDTMTVIARWKQLSSKKHQDDMSYWYVPRSPFMDFWTS